MALAKQAVLLNQIIKDSNEAVFDLLSKRGRAIYFPQQGILGQTKEAKDKKLNATIGMAYEDDGSIMALETMSDLVRLDKNLVFPYASSFGQPELREEWQKLILKKNPSLAEVNLSQPVVTNAVTHGLNVTGYLFVDEKTEIIIPEPAWDNYELVFNITYGAKITTFPLFYRDGLNLKGLKEKLRSGFLKKLLILNFPNNPTGYTLTEKEATELALIISDYSKKNKLIVACDDAYFGLVYEKGIIQESIFTKLAKASKNVLVVKLDGITKEDYAWGLRLGFVTFALKDGQKPLYLALEDKAAGAVRATISNASHLSQSLILKAILGKNYEQEKAEKRRILEARYKTVKKILKKNKHYQKFFTPLPFNSGYFMCLKLNQLEAEKVRKKLLQDYDTGLVVVDGLLRVAFSSLAKDKLIQVFDNIYQACQDLKS